MTHACRRVAAEAESVTERDTLESSVRDLHIMFLLKSFEDNSWIRPLLENKKFVPVKASSSLAYPGHLINEHETSMAVLFDTEEGRFPEQCLQDNDRVLKGLRLLGMPKKLSIAELRGRANTVCKISDSKKAMDRAWKLVKKSYSPYHGNVLNRYKELSDAMSNIPFLPVDKQPPDCEVPWHGSQALVEPCKVFSPKWNNVVFSVCPVVSYPDNYELKTDNYYCPNRCFSRTTFRASFVPSYKFK